MKLVKPSFEIIEQGKGLGNLYKHIELCGRTCYKSTDKITKDSAKPFVDRMIASQHYAMLEHGTVYLKIPYNLVHRITHPGLCSKYINNKYSVCNDIQEVMEGMVNMPIMTMEYLLVTTNLRVLVENGWEKDLEYLCDPLPQHAKRVTVRFVCNRQVSHEFVRHRVFSFAQESTRYCNYTKDKFGNELTFVEPCWLYDLDMNDGHDAYNCCMGTLDHIEKAYNDLIQIYGWKPQQAATILPNTLKTELVMTGFMTDWKHFFALRSEGKTGKPHPQAAELAQPLQLEFLNKGYFQ